MAPTYFSNAVARERIKRHIPDCKIIVTFREPAARLYSLYRLIRSGSRPASDTFDGYWRFQIDCGADLCSYVAAPQAMASGIWKVAGAGAAL